jgi:hypothetical protein
MKVIVKKTGGYAGLSEDLANINTSDETNLSSAEAKNIEQKVQSMKFFEIPKTIQSGVGADLEKYEITVSDGDRPPHTVTFVDDPTSTEPPEALSIRELLKTLKIQ